MSENTSTPLTGKNTTSPQSRIRGCLFGGAVGDALGGPVEFWSRNEILNNYPGGIKGYVDDSDSIRKIGYFTDDTQMTLFTSEAIIRTLQTDEPGNLIDAMVPQFVTSYLNWFQTQYPFMTKSELEQAGELVQREELNVPRAAGMTCVSSLEILKKSRGQGKIGSPENLINDSKGCGTVMRVAPIGLIPEDEQTIFELGCRASAITHGHPTGWLSGGALALLISLLFKGEKLLPAVERVIACLKTRPRSEETVAALEKAVALYPAPLPDYKAIGEIGQGWIAEEALGIAVLCALRYESNFHDGVLAAANITGDSDSTAAVTGNILGAYLGENAIPPLWISDLFERDVVELVANQLCNCIVK